MNFKIHCFTLIIICFAFHAFSQSEDYKHVGTHKEVHKSHKTYTYKFSSSATANYKSKTFVKDTSTEGAILPVLQPEEKNYAIGSGNYKMQFRSTRKTNKQDPALPKEEGPLVLKPSK